MRAVDPIHFFDALGKSVLEKNHHEERIKELEAEVDELTTLVARLQSRIRAWGMED